MNNGSCCNSKDGAQKSCCMSKCTPNVGTMDRLLRMAAGTVLVTLAATGQMGAWGFIGLALIASSVLGWCGMYTVLKIDTSKCCCTKSDTTTPPSTPV